MCQCGDTSKTHMRRAVELSAERMRANLGGPFGAVIVKDGKVIAEGFNQVTSTNDPTAHAEVVAIRTACKALDTFSLEGCEIYTSCEPCPMCLASIYWARLDAIYFGNSREDAAAIDLGVVTRDEIGDPRNGTDFLRLHIRFMPDENAFKTAEGFGRQIVRQRFPADHDAAGLADGYDIAEISSPTACS